MTIESAFIDQILANNNGNINLSQTSEYFINDQGVKIHVRSLFPANCIPKARVVYLHCYTLHVNTPTFGLIGKALNNESIEFVGMDFQGHGYSEGERGVIENFETFVRDAVQFITLLYRSVSVPNDSSILLPRNRLPFIVVGESFGGAIAIEVCKLITKASPEIADYFLGGLFLSPAISLDFSFYSQKAIEILSFLLPSLSIKTSVACPKELNWPDETMSEYLDRNRVSTCNLKSINSLIQLAKCVQASPSEITFPFLILHDFEDRIVTPSGSQRLMEQSQTVKESKQLVNVPGGRHDLFHSSGSIVVGHIIDFVNRNLILKFENHI